MIKNLINNKKYVRFHATDKEYDEYFGSGKLLTKAISKYGIENFIKGIIEYIKPEEWKEKEKFWIKEMKSHIKFNGYNLTFGGDGTLGYKDSKKTKLKKSKSLSGEKNGMYGKSLYNIWINKYGKEIANKKYLDYCKKTEGRISWNKDKKCPQLAGKNNGNYGGTWHGINPANRQQGKTLEEIYGYEKATKINIKRKLTKSIKITCVHCSKTIDNANYIRWHNGNCKLNPNNIIVK
jgi:group I intron endonuclease